MLTDLGHGLGEGGGKVVEVVVGYAEGLFGGALGGVGHGGLLLALWEDGMRKRIRGFGDLVQPGICARGAQRQGSWARRGSGPIAPR
ncbi:hypothetical protein GCM10009665_57250 [Kitasatospora nipponensis]|uniref:Uncharacterized protein n=1 Tax=Kitasatospora nipponensis TaxID=258049 RepID=A0ABN1WQR0_9ACTN